MACRFDLGCGGILAGNFEVFVGPSFSARNVEAFLPGALRYS